MSAKHDPHSPQARAAITRAYDAITTAMREAAGADRALGTLAAMAALQAAMATECAAAAKLRLPKDATSSFIEYGAEVGLNAIDAEEDGMPAPLQPHDVQ